MEGNYERIDKIKKRLFFGGKALFRGKEHCNYPENKTTKAHLKRKVEPCDYKDDIHKRNDDESGSE